MDRKHRVAVALELETPVPHHQGVYTGIQQYAAEHPGWECIVDEHPGLAPRGQGPKYGGVIARASPEMAKRLKRQRIPLVNVWYQHNDKSVPGVFPDPARLGEMAADHLMERGFRRMSCLVNPKRKYIDAIGRAFAARAKEEGALCLLRDFPSGSYKDPAYWLKFKAALNDWLDQLDLPVGLLFEVPHDVRIVESLCRERGWRVPQDVAMMSITNTKAVVESPTPQISSFDQNLERVGYEAAALLDRLMAGEQMPDRPLLLPPKSVIARESTDYFAVEDEVVAEALRFIASHLSDPLTVDWIAREIPVSPRSLQLKFDAALNRSVSEEVRRLRLEATKRLLAEPDKQIGEIAQMTGFATPSHMSRAFSKQMGLTPSAYRKLVLGNKQTD